MNHFDQRKTLAAIFQFNLPVPADVAASILEISEDVFLAMCARYDVPGIPKPGTAVFDFLNGSGPLPEEVQKLYRPDDILTMMNNYYAELGEIEE